MIACTNCTILSVATTLTLFFYILASPIVRVMTTLIGVFVLTEVKIVRRINIVRESTSSIRFRESVNLSGHRTFTWQPSLCSMMDPSSPDPY